MKTLVKGLEFVVVIVALVVGVYVGKTISVESILRKGLEPVTLAKTEEGLPEECVGRTISREWKIWLTGMRPGTMTTLPLNRKIL